MDGLRTIPARSIKEPKPAKYAPFDPLRAKVPVAEQIPWWIVLRGRRCNDLTVMLAIICAESKPWRKHIERIISEGASGSGRIDSWADFARVFGVHATHAKNWGESTHLSLGNLIVVAGVTNTPVADLLPKSYAQFIEDATTYLCNGSATAADIQCYAAYWAENPQQPRKEIDRAALSRAALARQISEERIIAAMRRVGGALEPRLNPYRPIIEDLIAEEKLS